MSRRIHEIEGIGPVYGQKLAEAGVRTDAELLEKAGSAKGRAKIAEQSGISLALLLKWVNHADLMRVSGIGPQFAELLEAAGVDTVRELAHRNAANLSSKLAEVNERLRLSGTTPAESQVETWIEAAKQMQPGVSH